VFLFLAYIIRDTNESCVVVVVVVVLLSYYIVVVLVLVLGCHRASCIVYMLLSCLRFVAVAVAVDDDDDDDAFIRS
jgi:hypothetical protein